MKKVYLAGQPKEYDPWKDELKKLEGFDFFDREIDSDQISPDVFFPDDLNGIHNMDIFVANPGTLLSEAIWIEVGYFLAIYTDNPGDTCKNLIIIWKEDREPKWSIEFVKKTEYIVPMAEEVKELLGRLK